MTAQTAYKIINIYLNQFGDRFFKIRGCEFIRTAYLDNKMSREKAVKLMYVFLREKAY